VIRVGISGWRYAPWRGVWYPAGLAHRRELEFCARHFPTVEINGSFYSLQRPESYEAWHRATPPGFVFAVKGSRYVTHFLKLKNVERPLANFFASGVLALREKLGPFLWQLPPTLAYERERLAAFFALLPRTTAAALALARRRDARMTGRARLTIDADRPVRHAVEVRHASFVNDEFRALAARHRVAVVVADTAGKWPLMLDPAGEVVYVRLHGDVRIYTSGYSDRALAAWARRIRRWAREGREVYVYFDNDVKVRAPFDALGLMRWLGLVWHPPDAGAEMPRHSPDARIPRGRRGYGPRVTGGSAWETLKRAGSPARTADGPADVPRARGQAPAGRTARRNSSTVRVFSTSRAVRSPRRAMSIP
jgi:uncharacterized protein YecE (DUF72 family)